MAKSPRACERFDGGWRFLKAEAKGAQAPAFDDKAWRQVELPHDWAIEDLEPLPPSAWVGVGQGTWRFQKGDDPAWKEPALDDAAWQEVQLPQPWENHSDYKEDNVYGWFRRRFDVPAELKGKEIQLAIGKVDDVDETFVNGVKVGQMGTFPPEYATACDKVRVYTVPASLLKFDGTDLVAVRVFDGESTGGIIEAAQPPVRSGPFDSAAVGGGAVGFTLGGVGWYRKEFRLNERWRGRRVWLTFDGVYMNCEVFCNGRKVARHPYGYTSFHVDLSDHVTFGKAANSLAVRVDASGRTSRWYCGAGIYRHVWLTVADPVHVEPWGVFVTTPAVSAREAAVRVRTTVRNAGGRVCKATVKSRVIAPSGKAVASCASELTVGPGKAVEFDQAEALQAPSLWTPETPALYRLESTVSVRGKVVDAMSTTFGVRSVRIDVENGLRINGEPVKLLGACVHHDNGSLGACTYDRAEERRVERLKAAGFNAIRTAHNPPSPAFLDACDQLGVYVMDEAFDTWLWAKNPQDYGVYFKQWWKRDIESMVLRDRNHPSVIFWSIGNEINGQDKPECRTLSRTLSRFTRKLDSTRPVAQAFMPIGNWDDLFEAFDALDLCGYNYKVDRYTVDHEKRPKQVIAGTESFPRGAFGTLMAAKDLPYVIGDFVWTGYDYIGEAALGRTRWDGEAPSSGIWPWNVAYCGDLDLCGWRRAGSFYREVAWGLRPMVACFVQTPHPMIATGEGLGPWGWADEQPFWTWPGKEGQPLFVQVYSSCPRVRLSLNGREIGAKDTNRDNQFTASWELPYEPGELVACGLDAQGREADRWVLKTAGPAAAVRLAPDRSPIRADGQDLCFVTVSLVDARGVLNPRADRLVTFTVEGPATIAAVGNADPTSLESFQLPQRRTFRGRCQVILKSTGKPGRIRLTAQAEGLEAAQAVLSAR